MGKFFSYDSKAIRFLNWLSDLMILNVLTVLCSLPIFTMGAAVTALYDTVWRIQENEEIKTVHTYFAAFKSNFKKATILWLIFLPIGVVLIYNLATSLSKDVLFPTIFSLFGVIWWLLSLAWMFPMQARFENTIWGTFKNCLMLPLGYFPRTLLMAFLNALPWVLVAEPGFHYYFALGGIVWFLIYFALAAHFNLKLAGKVYDRFYAQAASETTEE